MDETLASVAETHTTRNIRRAGEIFAHILVLTTWCLPLVFLPAPKGLMIMHIAWARVKAYIIAWMAIFLLDFNPLVAIGNPNPWTQQTTFCKVVEMLGIGQWRLQKLKFQCLGSYGLRMLESYEPAEEAVSKRFSLASEGPRRHLWSLYARGAPGAELIASRESGYLLASAFAS